MLVGQIYRGDTVVAYVEDVAGKCGGTIPSEMNTTSVLPGNPTQFHYWGYHPE
jgi:hypothetical protein